MSELFREYLPAILIAVALGLVIAFLIFRPRQRVRLTDSAAPPPHDAKNARDSAARRKRIAAEAAAAACDVSGRSSARRSTGTCPAAARPRRLPADQASGPAAEMLHARGFVRFAQLAHLTPEEIEMIDQQLGAFRGRLRRDRIAEQAVYLARGDVDGFEQHFGKL